ncbi:type ISP restriction/modification enzyme [Borreliella garinii]|uniref:type ISP restriction/modification enzyme n=1 Tax=Borreliella garinii TaxID=29519 RepID=UPI001AEED460|nr:type ISP restriction/modification enzyme [Borreliella garinii]
MNNNEFLFKKAKEYIANLRSTKLEEKTEHSNRTHLENLLNDFNKINQNSSIAIQHEPRRSKEGFGSPDYIVRHNITQGTIGCIEVKKVEQNLDETLKSSQIEKYKNITRSILLTNYIEFIWIKDKEIKLRESLLTKEELYSKDTKLDKNKLTNIINILFEFFNSNFEKIKSIEALAILLASKTKSLKEEIEVNLKENEEKLNLDIDELGLGELNVLVSTCRILKKSIYSDDFSISEFSDSIAQTITYGLFIARLNSKENIEINFQNIENFIPTNFSLIQNIIKLIKDIHKDSEFNYLRWILESIISIVNNIDTKLIFNEFSFTNSSLNSKDPYLYFYENFLAKYDADLRKAKGVYYTPSPIVSFIVNSLNEILKKEFKLNHGFANKEKVTVLDFATGTGTFLLEVIRTIILKEIPEESGRQKDYINLHILKNLYGFEYLMAPYVVAHLKLSQYLKEVCKFDFNKDSKLKVYLTNTLDLKEITDQKFFSFSFFKDIAKETKEANEIKRNPILVILGNPPYSAESKNNNQYILNLVNDYKKIKNSPINERNTKTLNDDYVKFIRFAENKLEDNKKEGLLTIKGSEEGLLGIITNNGYLDNITFRGMRHHLLSTFDEIYILNLHGSSRKKEKTDDGSIDENVFDIQTGVAIAIFTKYKEKEKKNKLANVYYSSIKGKRDHKYDFLNKNHIYDLNFEKLDYKEPNYFFLKKDLSNEDIYNKGKSLIDIFNEFTVGIVTRKDKIAIDYTKDNLMDKLKDFAYLPEQDARNKYDIEKDSMFWKLSEIQKFLKNTNFNKSYVKEISYRPFDNRFTYYSKNKGIVVEPRYKIMKHISEIEGNIGLVTTRLLSTNSFKHALVTSEISDKCFVSNKGSESCYLFPLYIKENQGIFKDIKKENFKKNEKDNKDIFREFINTKYSKIFTPEEIFGYIYAVLYSNIYREKFVEFLKIDYPKIIFVNNVDTFLELSNLGTKLINSHLLKDNLKLNNSIGNHTGDYNRIVEKITYKEDTKELYYNSTCCFTNVAKEVYEYEIGSYQVLKSYLKYRKGKELIINENEDEIEHLEKVIKVLSYTINVQKGIDEIIQNLKEFNE